MQYIIRAVRRACIAISVSALCAFCQQPPPPPAGPPPPQPGPAAQPLGPQPGPAPQQVFSRTGTIRRWNYGPKGDINGFVLDRDILVMFPPDAAASFTGMARLGSRIGVFGYGYSGLNVPTVVQAQTITLNGQTFNISAPAGGPGPAAGPPPPPPGRGRRRPPAPAGANAPPPPPPNGATPPPPPPGPQAPLAGPQQ